MLTCDPELVPQCVGILLHVALSAKHWLRLFVSAGRAVPGPIQILASLSSSGFVPQSPDLDPDLSLSQPGPFQTDPFFFFTICL